MIVPEMMEHVFAPTADPNWVFLVDGYDSLRESSVESRFAISNGFLGVRGARSTTRGGRWVVPARTYVAGLFDTSGTDHATRGLIPAADWLGIRILLPGGPLLHHPGDISSHRMTLDMRRDALLSEGRHLKAPDLGLHVQTSRLVSLSDRAIGLQLIRMEIEDGELDMTLEASFEGTELGLVVDRLGQDLGLWHTQHSSRLDLKAGELKEWLHVAETMATGLDPATGLFEQFAGYFALEDIDLANYAGRTVPMDVVLGHERTQKSQVVKQADVVALLGLLPQEFAGDAKSANFRYYEPRCSHGSSLSPAMHGLVAARLGDTEMALRFFRQTAAIDLADTHAATDGGVHIAALGGIWMLAVFGFAGLSLNNDGLTVDPRLPAGWRYLTFRVQWRGRSLRISIDPGKQTVEAIVEAGEPMVLFVGGEPNQISSAATLVIPIRSPQ